MKPETAQLSPLPLFEGLTPREFEILRTHVEIKAFGQNEDLFREGDAASSCYVLVSGRVGVYLGTSSGQEEELAQLTPGAMVGHMALVDNKRRSATCRSLTADTVLVELRRDDFERLFWAQTPFTYKILENLAVDLVGRLRATNERLVKAQKPSNSAPAERKHAKAAAQQLLGYRSDHNFKLSDINPDDVEVVDLGLNQRMRDPTKK